MADDRYNVIFILTDDQGPWAAGCCGNPEIRTPNIDRLAATGMRFENFFCASPVCSPARASLITGRIPSQHGVHDWISERNMPPDAAQYIDGFTCYTDVLAANGHVCGLSGKWHLGDSITPQHGFSYWFAHTRGGGHYNDQDLIDNGEIVSTKGYVSDIFTDKAIGFVDANKDRPFYLSLHFTAPHSPWIDEHPRDVVDSYDDCPFKSCPQEMAHPWIGGLGRQNMGNRESLKGYFAAVTAMDANVGRVIDRVEQLGLREKTLIVFTSDNGFSCGHHGFWGKGNGTWPLNMYENSVKVPAVFSHPGVIPQGVVSKAMVSQYDWMPTVLDYVGAPAVDDETLPGTSFVSVLKGETNEARDDVVVYDEYGSTRMIRTHEWKYIHRFPRGPLELYDLVNDPDERRNLVDEESQQPRVTEMRRRLAQWFGRYVTPELDGVRFPVCGSGQKDKIGPDCPGESAFGPIRG